MNSGLSNEIRAELVIEEISKHAYLSDITLLPDKSFCFIKFDCSSDATLALNALNGAPLGQNGAPLMISYCKNIPASSYNTWSSNPPNGLILLEDFITEEMEQKLIAQLQWNQDDCENQLKNRKVIHFGYEFIYGSNNVDPNCPLDKKIPKDCEQLWDILKQRYPSFRKFQPDQLTVNRYAPGDGIPPHCDTHSCFEDPIVSLSLGSSIVMDFKQSQTSEKTRMLLPQRSLLIMSGEARYGWTHGIAPRMSDIVLSSNRHLTVQKRGVRFSFTFRKLRMPPDCSCSFPLLCDIARTPQITPEQDMSEQLAAKLEIENVHKVYNEIGSHFSETRHSPWPNVMNYIRSLPDGSIILDVGCGNGKYLGFEGNVLKLGCDRSDSLLEVCVEKDFNVFQCDCLQLPIRDCSIDSCISIAVIHHLATSERRLKAISEIVRVLVPGGTSLIYVWAKDQQKDNKKSSYLLQNQKQKSEVKPVETAVFRTDSDQIQLPVHRNRTQFNYTNVFVPWKLKQKEIPESEQKTFLRYYHVFEDGELEKLCHQLKNVEIVKSYYDQGNHCVVIKKLDKINCN